MSRHMVVSLSEVDYHTICKLIRQNEIKREQSRLRHETKTGNKCIQHVLPPTINVVAEIDVINNPQALIMLNEVAKLAPPAR